MDVLILGAGAVGTLLAFRLALAGHKVTAVGRAAFVRAVESHGLMFECDGRAGCVDRLMAVQDTRSLGESQFDLVLITTRTFDTAVAAVQALPFVQRGARAVVMQDGVGGLEVAQGILGEPNLFVGVMTISVDMLKPGVVRQGHHRGGIAVAAANGHAPAFLVDLLVQAGFETRQVQDVRALQWSRLLTGMLANAIPAILDWPPDQVYKNRRLYELELDALREALLVVQRMGIELVSLPGCPVPTLVWSLTHMPSSITRMTFIRAVVNGRAGRRPSLHTELARGRKSEVEFLNGAVTREGKKVGAPTPVNLALCETLLGIAQGKVSWNEYRGQTDRLISRIRAGDSSMARKGSAKRFDLGRRDA
ncbi:MAG: ketopantoate reductase family protein [Anaerolineae bacterium]|nr:ketopantoate reductase family protein [Anaerolineae bacterium]